MKTMTSLERVITTLGHNEPDRVPVFLLLTMHGAKELGLSIKAYFSSAINVYEGQKSLIKKYDHDCIVNFNYASLEIEAFGGETIFVEDGPPNSAAPVIQKFSEINSLKVPDIQSSAGLKRVLETTEMLYKQFGGIKPIIGVVMSPFSLPVMQMGFDKYIDLIYDAPVLFRQLMKINQEFCINWANAQLQAGATAICYFDPVSSSTIIPPELYEVTGREIAKETIAKINGPTATHFASGRITPIIDKIATTGTAIIGVSTDENLAVVKKIAGKRLTLLGNLNGIEMRTWNSKTIEKNVKKAIQNAAVGGGFILSDNHGEIPFQVADETLFGIVENARKWGTYPILNCCKDE